MKKTRKLLALMMVLATMLSVFALPVSAASTEGEAMSPLYLAFACPICGDEADLFTKSVTMTIPEGGCYLDPDITVHYHVYYYLDTYASCSICGNTRIKRETTKVFCGRTQIR